MDGDHEDDSHAIGKSDAVPVVLQWLENNYEQHMGSSIAKQDVYQEYTDFCRKHRIEPTSASAFGRLVRLAFPATTSRRLGARGANVTVYNHFRARPAARNRCSDSTFSPAADTLSLTPPSSPPQQQHLHRSTSSLLLSLCSNDGSGSGSGGGRLRGGAANKQDGRTLSIDDVKLDGRTSSFTPMRSSLDATDESDDVLLSHCTVDEPEKQQQRAGIRSFLNSEFGENTTISSSSSSLESGAPSSHQQTANQLASLCASTPEHQHSFGIDGEVVLGSGGSSSNLLMKMLKSEENSADLYDTVQRVLYGINAPQMSSHYGKDGMELEAGDNLSHKQLQLYQGEQQQQQQQQQQEQDHLYNRDEREKKPGLWNADTHLHLMKFCETYRDCYSHNLWLLNPLHPAALEDDNIRYIICTEEGAEERSPLSLSIYWILYSGALMTNHTERAIEFYNKARDHLGHVFDQTDSSISLVLLPMAYHSRFWAHNEEDGLSRCAYYLTLAMEICKRLGPLGSSVYISCLQMYAWFCMTNDTSLTYEEKLREVRKGTFYPMIPMALQTAAVPPRNAWTSVHIPITHLQMVEKMFGVVGNIMKGIFIFKATIWQSARQTSNYYSQPGAGYSHKRKQAEEPSVPSTQQQQEQVYSLPTQPEHQAKHAKCANSFEDSVRQHSYEYGHDVPPIQQQPQQQPFTIAAAIHSFQPNSTLQPLLLPLETMEQDLELLMQSRNPIPFNIYMMFKLWILGERAECFWCMGLLRESLQTALCFLDVSKRSTKNFISHFVSVQPILEMVLNVFVALYRFDDFRELLDAILEPLDKSIPHVARSKARYMSLLFAANPVFSASADIIDTPSSATSSTNLHHTYSGDEEYGSVPGRAYSHVYYPTPTDIKEGQNSSSVRP